MQTNTARKTLDLNGVWDLVFTEDAPEQYCGVIPSKRPALAAVVPSPVHQTLIEAGMLDDPHVGLNSLKARWVEEQYWIYRRTITLTADEIRGFAWLIFERLEFDAQVWLNGHWLGHHANAHRPAMFPLASMFQEGENLLVVVLESGLMASAGKESAGYPIFPSNPMTKRQWHRKPQYQAGWDWQQRLLNVGILGNVRLEWSRGPRVAQVSVVAIVAPDLSQATVQGRLFVDNPTDAPMEARLTMRVAETGQQESRSVQIAPGLSRQELKIVIDSPILWWPLGHGEQHRYTVEISLECGETQTETRKVGCRRVEMDQSPHPKEGRYCILTINNRRVFCKGGNWVPADMLYSTVTAERTQELVRLAVDANFNLLRMWGGGVYADHALCEACDAAGMMLWHDFGFACAQYPGHDPAFLTEVRQEAAYVVRELAHHPSLVVWCGNNEVEWGDWEWGYDKQLPAHPHYVIFHHDLPKIVHEENPTVVHWIGSPWSPDYQPQNDPTMGDQHPWNVSIAEPSPPDWWNYRRNVDRFPNEGGVLGASSPATLREFLPEGERALLSPSWEHHDNLFAMRGDKPGDIGRSYEAVTLWTGRDPFALDWETYAFTSALLQAEGLAEYITNYRRRMFSSAAAVFWMFNDSWPATHGWTIVDYYRRKKLAYHPVRRAFQSVTVVVAEEGETVTIFGVNDTPAEWAGDLRWGLFALSGGLPLDNQQAVSLPANASTQLASFARSEWEALGTTKHGAFAVLSQHSKPTAQHRLFVERFHHLSAVPANIRLTVADNCLTLLAPAYVWGVCVDIDGESPVADNCFDLLPGIPYQMPWNAALGEPKIIRTGQDVLLLPT